MDWDKLSDFEKYNLMDQIRSVSTARTHDMKQIKYINLGYGKFMAEHMATDYARHYPYGHDGYAVIPFTIGVIDIWKR